MSNGTGTCRHDACRASLLWRENVQTGKRVPLDAAPITEEQRIIGARRHHYVLVDGETCRQVTADEWQDHGLPVSISHWRTCCAAEFFAGRKGR